MTRIQLRVIMLVAFIAAGSCSQTGNNAGDSPLVPLPTPPITRAYPIEIDFSGLPNGAIDPPTQVEDVQIGGDDAIVNDGIVLLNPGQLFMAPPEPVSEVAVMVQAQSQSAVIVGSDSRGSQVAQSFTWNLGDYYYYTIRSTASDINSVVVTGPDSSIAKVIFARPFDFVSFTTGFSTSFGGSASDVIVTDIDSDGKTDVIIGSPSSSEIVVAYGDGVGGFALTQTLAATSAPGKMILSDLDGDGLSELIVALPSANSIKVFENASGSLVPGPTYAAGTSPAALDSGDANGDLANDIVVGGGSGVCLLLNDNLGAGGLLACAPTGIAGAVADIKLADLDIDGDLDIVAAHTGINSIDVHKGDGAGAFDPVAFDSIDLGSQSPKTIVVNTLDWDQYPDLAAGLSGSPNFRTWRNKKNGAFDGSALQSFDAVPGSLSDTIAADINADGFVDLAFADSSSGSIAVYATLLMGQVQPVTTIDNAPAQTMLGAGDMNGDYKNDLIAVDQFGDLRVFLNVSH